MRSSLSATRAPRRLRAFEKRSGSCRAPLRANAARRQPSGTEDTLNGARSSWHWVGCGHGHLRVPSYLPLRGGCVPAWSASCTAESGRRAFSRAVIQRGGGGFWFCENGGPGKNEKRVHGCTRGENAARPRLHGCPCGLRVRARCGLGKLRLSLPGEPHGNGPHVGLKREAGVRGAKPGFELQSGRLPVGNQVQLACIAVAACY